MKSTNYPSMGHEILVVQREKEILLVSKSTGKEFASITMCMMEGDKELSGGKYETYVTNNFWLEFRPKVCQTDKSAADCYVE